MLWQRFWRQLFAFFGAKNARLALNPHLGAKKMVQGGKIELFAPKAHPGPLKGIDFHWVFVCPAHGRLLGRKSAICRGKLHPGAGKFNLCCFLVFGATWGPSQAARL